MIVVVVVVLLLLLLHVLAQRVQKSAQVCLRGCCRPHVGEEHVHAVQTRHERTGQPIKTEWCLSCGCMPLRGRQRPSRRGSLGEERTEPFEVRNRYASVLCDARDAIR
jgi:hypothetical protein